MKEQETKKGNDVMHGVLGYVDIVGQDNFVVGSVYRDFSDKAGKSDNKPSNTSTVPLNSGDLVKVFKTVSRGEVAYSVTVDADVRDLRGSRSADLHKFAADGITAVLERDGQTIYGAFDLFWEQGCAPAFIISEYGKSGYDSIVMLEDGDELTFYSKVYDGDVEWEGTLDFSEFGKPVNIRDYVFSLARDTNHMDVNDWFALVLQNRPVQVQAPDTPRI